MNTLYELRDNVCCALEDITKKGADISRQDVETAYYAVKLVDLIERMGDRDAEQGTTNRYSARRRGADGRFYDGRPYTERSGHSADDRIIANLESMMGDASSDYERQKIQEWIRKIKADK